MLDIDFIRDNKEKIIEAVEKKCIKIEIFDGVVTKALSAQEFVDLLLETDKRRRDLISKVDALRKERNEISQTIAKTTDKTQKAKLITKAREIKTQLETYETELEGVEKDFYDLMLRVPNIPADDVPYGVSEEDNVEIKRWGKIPEFDFTPKDHIELGELLDIIDIPRGVKIAGTRSYYLKNEGALLELAVCKFALDFLVKKGFTPFIVPLMVKDQAMVGAGFFPGGEEQAYRLEKDKLNLIGTSEVSLVAYHSGEILDEDELPKLYAGFSACFRREAGTYGRDTRGVYRVHQFHKVEQVVLCKNDPKISRKMHNFILQNAEEILQALGLPYRVVLVCTGEMGQGQVYKHDIETWMPSRNKYSETHSCSTLHDFQARRLNIRYRDKKGKTHFVHTLNNTAIASPRILIPLLEIYQQPNGSVVIPEVLRPYMGGMEKIEPKPRGNKIIM